MDKFEHIKPKDNDCVLVLADDCFYIGYCSYTAHHTYPHRLKNKHNSTLGDFTDDGKWSICNPTLDDIDLPYMI